MEKLLKDYSAQIKESEPNDRRVTAIITTNSVDRDGDIVVPLGIDLVPYQANPVVLWNHNSEVPIARAIALRASDSGIEADVEFPPAGVSDKADEILGLIKAGVVNATSIGFMPLEYEFVEMEAEDSYGFEIQKSELFEFSFVSVPSNRDAQITQRSALAARLTPKTFGSTEQRTRHIRLHQMRIEA